MTRMLDFLATKEKLYTPSQDYRADSENVFFANKLKVETKPLLPLALKQIRVNRSPISQLDHNELKLEQKLSKIISFFNKFAFVSTSNLKIIQNLLVDYFSHSSSLKESVLRFKEEIDKSSKDDHSLGKLFVCTTFKGNSLRLTLTRKKAKDVKQYISFFLDESLQSELCVYTTDSIKRKSEVIKNSSSKNRTFNQNQNSIDFDAKVWQSFNFAGIQRKNYLKTLDCIERNRLNLGQLINTINKKDLTNLFAKDLINQVKIRTDNKHVLCLDFVTNLEQKVEAKLTKDAVTIAITESIA